MVGGSFFYLVEEFIEKLGIEVIVDEEVVDEADSIHLAIADVKEATKHVLECRDDGLG